MDSNKPATKRGVEVMLLENQDVDMSSLSIEDGDGAKVKRFKQVLHPLQMGAVLEQIFSNLDPDSIKAARQVNPLWSIEGAKVLITKCYVKIPSVIHFGENASKFKAMDEFKAFLSYKSIDFSTIPNIIVDAVSDVEEWKYLGILGQVKSLKINNIPSENEVLFFKNLLDLLPNLNYLKFEELKGKPELIRVLVSVMSTLEKDGNSLVISFLNLHPENEEQLEDIEKFAECKNIMIEDLKFFYGVPNIETRISSILGKLLSTSQNILKKLTLQKCNLILPLLEFPCMTALTSIVLIFNFQTAGQLSQFKFSPNFRFSEKLPKLQEIGMIGNQKQEIAPHCLPNLLQSAGTAPSVKKVKCWGKVSDLDIYHIFKTFPDLEYLRTSVSKHSQAMLGSLWKHGKKLTKLRLDVDVFPQLGEADDLDSSFTGLPGWAVNEIKSLPNLDPFSKEEVEGLRINSSILNLQELKYLLICFHGNARDYPNRMLAVVGKFGFSLLPKNPRIDIRVKNWGSLDEIKEAFDEVSKLPNVIVSNLDD